MSNAIQTLTADTMRKQIRDALPLTLSNHADKFVRVAITEIRKSQKLQQCNPMSICGAVMQAAQLGLEFGSTLGQAWLVPYGSEATLMIGYRGLIALARRSGDIKKIEARVVYKGDDFEYEYGLEPKLTHKPCGNTDELEYVYAVAQLADGSTQFEVMNKAQIEHIRTTFSRGSDTWKKSYDEMSRKTVIRRLMKLLPLSTELAEALDYEADQFDRHDPEKVERVLDGQMQLSDGEKEHALNRWRAAAEAANERGVDYSDFTLDDHSPQIILGYAVELERRIAEWETKSKSESKA